MRQTQNKCEREQKKINNNVQIKIILQKISGIMLMTILHCLMCTLLKNRYPYECKVKMFAFDQRDKIVYASNLYV